jgi:hypothetical protein
VVGSVERATTIEGLGPRLRLVDEILIRLYYEARVAAYCGLVPLREVETMTADEIIEAHVVLQDGTEAALARGWAMMQCPFTRRTDS